jgi:hypothetical protein
MDATCVGDFQTAWSLQPINTISSFAFIIAALYIIWRYRDVSAYFYGLLLTIIGIGSAYFHAEVNFLGQSIDSAGIYLLVSFVLLVELVKTEKFAFSVAYAFTNTALIVTVLLEPGVRKYLFLILALLLIFTLHRRHTKKRYLTMSLILMLAATSMYLLDVKSGWCIPGTAIHGHTIWHILSAFSAVFLYYAVRWRLAHPFFHPK